MGDASIITMQKKRIAYVTGTRADFGLMAPILRAIQKSPSLELVLYATGIHLMPEFGRTADVVRQEFPDVQEIPVVFENDKREAMAAFAGTFLTAVTDAFKKDKPDFVLTLGDRPEMLAVATACLYLGIPTGQVHGGEKTSTVDELARHAIAKLSHVHFAATEESAERLLKMGEDKWRVYVVGAPALDVILNEALPTREELFARLGLNVAEPVILLTQHPVSEEAGEAAAQIEATIQAVKEHNMPVVVIYPHADAGGRAMIEIIDKEKDNPTFRIVPSLPHKEFLALEREAAVWVGNSSGALIESSCFRTPVVNIGTREQGRQRGGNVLDSGYSAQEISAAINRALHNEDYRSMLKTLESPWGDGKTGPRVAKILEELVIDKKLISKQISY